MPTKKKTSHTGATLMGVGAILAAAAGTYLLYGSKDAQKNRKVVKGWMLKAKGEILEQLEKLPTVDEKTYHAIVEKVTQKYQTLSHIDKADVERLAKEARSHWKNIKKHIAVTPSKKTAKK